MTVVLATIVRPSISPQSISASRDSRPAANRQDEAMTQTELTPESPSPESVAHNRLPSQTAFIVGNEACERFCYYGIMAVLMAYLTSANSLKMKDDQATEIIHLFKSAVYLTPLLGAWIADRWLGRYRTILFVSLVYCLGNLVLATTAGNVWGLYAGLFLIALGAGGIKPCVSTFVGDQFGPHQQHLLPKVYGLFYWSINFGSFFAFGLIPAVRDNYGYAWAFGIPGIFMAMATLILWLGRKRYVRVPPAVSQPQKRQPIRTTIKAVAGILMIFASAPFFWALYDQTSSTWIIQGKQMQVWDALSFHLGRVPQVFDMFLKLLFTGAADATGTGCTYVLKLDADRMQSFNPLLIMLLIPAFMWLYPKLEQWTGIRISPLRRMVTGMVLLAVSFVIVGWFQQRIDQGEQISIVWQTLPYTLLTIGEILFSATGLEFAFSQAPASMKSTIMSFWLLTTAAGNALVALLTFLGRKTGLIAETASGTAPASVPANQFFLYAVLLAVVTGFFMWSAIRYKEQKPAM